MDTANHEPITLDNKIEDSGMTVTPAWKMAAVPGSLLIGINLLPIFGIEIPVQLFGIAGQAWIALISAVIFALSLPAFWRSGFRTASDNIGEDAKLISVEASRKLQEARYQEQKRSKELEIALGRLKTADQQLRDLQTSSHRNQATAHILVESTGEAIVVTDIHGVIEAMSLAASNLSGVHRKDAQSHPFDDIFHLFDPTSENPEIHPVRRIAIRAVDSADPAPKLESCILTNRIGKSTNVLITSMAITDREGTAIGAYIKLETQDAEDGIEGVERRVPTQIDPITGLKTKDAFLRRTDELLRSARSGATMHQMLFIAPDNMDFVADRHGYRAAEQLLWKIAETCREQADERCEIYAISTLRIGILMREAEQDDALAIAERIRNSLQQTTLSWNEQSFELPATITIVQIDRSSPAVGHILDLAENLLRNGRRAGGSQVYTGSASAPVDDSRFNDQGWVTWLQQRLKAGLGHLLSQEIHSASKDNMPMVECYVRVEDTDGVWISPREYLAALRREGKTAFMDLWVLEQILDQLQAQPDLMDRYQAITLNLAAETVLDADFVARASQRIAASHVHARHICFEILENCATTNPREVSHFVSLIQSAGARVAIDQSRGVGLRQLLRDCKPDFVKLDPSLVREFDRDPLTAAQLRWVIDSATIMRVPTVACGIEDPSTVDELRALGVSYLQGSAINKIGPLMV